MKPIVRSLLEQDLYKFTMQQVMLHQFPDAHARYDFACRNDSKYPLASLEQDINRELDHLCSLQFLDDEIDWLRKRRFFRTDYIEFLSLFRFRRKFITVQRSGDGLLIRAEGPQIHVMGFEIYVLYIVSELYMRRFDFESSLEEGKRRAHEKVKLLKDFGSRVQMRHPYEFFDYGLRRRHSAAMQDFVIELFASEVPEYFKGTSNCYLAKKLGLTPIGTMAHEFLQSFQGLDVRLRDFQKSALEAWVRTYRGDLGTALTDVVGMDAFLADFDLYFAKLFDALRHDSGDPVLWAEKALAHYAKLHIDTNTKRLVFSDGLNFEKSFDLYGRFADRIKHGSGIGTHLTNDTGIEPLNLVMKLVEMNGQSVAKLSDTPGKTMSNDKKFIEYLRQVFDKSE